MDVSGGAGEDGEGGWWREDAVETHHLFSNSCEPNPYLFGGHHPPQDMMTLEFVAVLAEHSKLDERSKICVVFYKQPGHCEEFANMEKR